MSVRLPVTGGHVRATSGCSTATFHTVSGTNLTWPSDNGAGKVMRARFGKYVAQSNEDNRKNENNSENGSATLQTEGDDRKACCSNILLAFMLHIIA